MRIGETVSAGSLCFSLGIAFLPSDGSRKPIPETGFLAGVPPAAIYRGLMREVGLELVQVIYRQLGRIYPRLDLHPVRRVHQLRTGTQGFEPGFHGLQSVRPDHRSKCFKFFSLLVSSLLVSSLLRPFHFAKFPYSVSAEIPLVFRPVTPSNDWIRYK